MSKRVHSPSRRPRRSHCPILEVLEGRSLPSTTPFAFSTGNPDGKMATISEPPNMTQNNNVEFESADDFVLATETQVNQATFTGLLTGGAGTGDVDPNNVIVEIYRVFPKDSNTARTPAVPTRANSPSDVVFVTRSTATPTEATEQTALLNGNFTAQNSVSTAAKIAVNSMGDGMVTGSEVQFTVTFTTPLDLPPDHYFFVPQVGLKATAPAGSHFLWLSAPKPIVAPGTPFTPDLQSWMRDDPTLAPDWLRIGTDIVGGATPPTFNAAFSLAGTSFTPQITGLNRTAAAEGSPGFTLTVTGTDFTAGSTVLFNGMPLATTFVSATQLTATVPSGLLADEGMANVSVADAQRGLSNGQSFTIVEVPPVLSNVKVVQDHTRFRATATGSFLDVASEPHTVKVDWGDGTTDMMSFGAGMTGSFNLMHRYSRKNFHRRFTIKVTVMDDEGTMSSAQTFSVRVGR